MKPFIQSERSVIVAADVPDFLRLGNLAEAMEGIPGIGGFKLGLTLGFEGLTEAVKIVKNHMGSNFPVIFDHQKAGNDIPEMGQSFANALKKAGVDTAILFPFAGPVTQETWTKACFDAGLNVLTGGVMTHPKFLVSEGGYFPDEKVEVIYRNACHFGCEHFVVPGTKLDWVERIHGWVTEELGADNFDLSAPGLITQGGDISECGQAAGKKWHAIIGSAIYKQPNREEMRRAATAATRLVAV